MDHPQQEEGSLHSLPTPTDTPYRTPPRSRSQQSRRHGSISPDISSSPVPLQLNDNISPKRGHNAINSATDENISPLDPRRFTPSLHASLVSEILSLRREVESKTTDIEQLESSLDGTRNENQSLHDTLASTTTDIRSLRRQIQLLEGGTVSALHGLSEERDEAVNDVADLRKRLDQSQKRIRSQEESAERIQMLWDRERGAWESEKRVLETKVHIVEGRLKVVLSEMAKSNMVNGHTLPQDVNHNESPKKLHRRKESVASIRSIGFIGRRRDSEVSSGTQEADLHGYRLSTLVLANGHPTSLMDELAFDEEEEDQIDQMGGQEEQISSDELPEERRLSAQSRPMDSKARKILGIAPDEQFPIFVENEQQRQNSDMTMRSELVRKRHTLHANHYVDVAVQYSPPPSPKLPTAAIDTTMIESKAAGNDDKAIELSGAISQPDSDVASKRSQTNQAPITPLKPSSMISTSCQTSSELPTPPWTPLSVFDPTNEKQHASLSSEVQTTSTATQTEIVDVAADCHADNISIMPVPIISIHPPASRPTSPTTSVVLPPRTKNASCQVEMQLLVGYTSSSMQTDEVRVDTRTPQIPPKSLPSKTQFPSTEYRSGRKSSALQPTNPLPNSSRRRLQQPGPIKPGIARRGGWDSTINAGAQPVKSEVAEPTVPAQTESQVRTSDSSTSVVADVNHQKDDRGEPEGKQFNEDDIFSRPTAKFTLRAGKLVLKDEPENDYQDIFDKIDAEASEPEASPVDDISPEPPIIFSRRDSKASAPLARPLERKQRTLRSTSSKQFDIRKAALISSGTAAHQSARDRNPSASVVSPPFPVPMRHSSRKSPFSVSEGARSPTPTSRSPRKREGKGRKPPLRKVRSATNVSRSPVSGHRRNPSPLSPSFEYDTKDCPVIPLPPMPFDDLLPAPGVNLATSFRRRGPVRQDLHSSTDSASTLPQQTSVVDAIAQTMVGEWMFKYVRRRKSFGVPEPKSQEWDLMRNGEEHSTNITNSGLRHKRWVWLAPYERAVMWSSKQPTSGSSLMGKSGRKLEIQSVLDVRDDNPLPKGSGTAHHFSRSILILTPERALKFTAITQERHYVWLTALSFLSHSPLGLADLTALPAIPAIPLPHEHIIPRPGGGSLRRNPIRDSIRVAKGRDPRGARAGKRSFTTDGVIPQIHSDREDLYNSHDAIYESISDAADPPTVPRYHSHPRHRSNTGPRAPPPSLRNFPNHNNFNSVALPPPSTYSTSTATTSDIYTPSLYSSGHHYPSGFPSAKSSFSRHRRGSEASVSVIAASSVHPAAPTAGYFDHHPHHVTPPTMRMEAFISEDATQRPRGSYRTHQGRKKDMGYWGAGDRVSPPTTTMPIPMPITTPLSGLELPHESAVAGGPRTSSRARSYLAYPATDALSLVGESPEQVEVTRRRLVRDDPALEAALRRGAADHFDGF